MAPVMCLGFFQATLTRQGQGQVVVGHGTILLDAHGLLQDGHGFSESALIPKQYAQVAIGGYVVWLEPQGLHITLGRFVVLASLLIDQRQVKMCLGKARHELDGLFVRLQQGVL